MEFEEEKRKCKFCNIDLKEQNALFDGEFLYCDERHYAQTNQLKKVFVERINTNRAEIKYNVIKNKIRSIEDRFNAKKVGEQIYYYNSNPKTDNDGSFHDYMSTLIVEDERLIELTLRFLGDDPYHDRVFTSASYEKYTDTIFNTYSNKDAVYYKYKKYDNYIHEMIGIYRDEIRNTFNPLKVDGVYFKKGFFER